MGKMQKSVPPSSPWGGVWMPLGGGRRLERQAQSEWQGSCGSGPGPGTYKGRVSTDTFEAGECCQCGAVEGSLWQQWRETGMLAQSWPGGGDQPGGFCNRPGKRSPNPD